MPNEHDDDLAPSVETWNDMETDDFPRTTDDFDAQEEDQDQDGNDRDDRDDESVVGK